MGGSSETIEWKVCWSRNVIVRWMACYRMKLTRKLSTILTKLMPPCPKRLYQRLCRIRRVQFQWMRNRTRIILTQNDKEVQRVSYRQRCEGWPHSVVTACSVRVAEMRNGGAMRREGPERCTSVIHQIIRYIDPCSSLRRKLSVVMSVPFQ